MTLNEDILEQAALSWFAELDYEVLNGLGIAPGEPNAERDSFGQVVLEGRLRDAVDCLNPEVPADGQEDAIRKVLRPDLPTAIRNNRVFHRQLRDGVEVEYRRSDGTIAGDQVRLIDFDQSDNNDWLALNQFTVIEDGHHGRPDLLVFVNGLPLATFELKNQADEDATVDKAYDQLQTYKKEIPSLFHFNELSVASDGRTARLGAFTAGFEWF